MMMESARECWSWVMSFCGERGDAMRNEANRGGVAEHVGALAGAVPGPCDAQAVAESKPESCGAAEPAAVSEPAPPGTHSPPADEGAHLAEPSIAQPTLAPCPPSEPQLDICGAVGPAHEPTAEDLAELHSFMASTAGAATQRPGEDTQPRAASAAPKACPQAIAQPPPAPATGAATQRPPSSADAARDAYELPAASCDVTGAAPQLPAARDDASDASQLAGIIERRLATNGGFYTMVEFARWYGEDSFMSYWEDAAPADPYSALSPPAPHPASAGSDYSTGTAAQPPAGSEEATEGALQLPASSAEATGDASQLPAGADDGPPTPAQLRPEDVIGIQNAEAARGPPRSLHKMARDALNRISASPTRDSVLLDDVFPWMQYVAAHRQAFDIIGPGITRAMAMWKPRTNDNNRGGAERLDLHFFREDGTVCRVHPGGTRRGDARLIFERAQ